MKEMVSVASSASVLAVALVPCLFAVICCTRFDSGSVVGAQRIGLETDARIRCNLSGNSSAQAVSQPTQQAAREVVERGKLWEMLHL